MRKRARLFCWSILFVSCSLPPSGVEQKIVFDRIENLSTGSNMLLNGLSVGVVKSVGLDEKYRVEVTVEMNEDVNIPSDSRFILCQSPLGIGYIQIIPGKANSVLKGGDTTVGEIRDIGQDSVSVSNEGGQLLKNLIDRVSGKKQQDSMLNEIKKLHEKVDKLERRLQEIEK